MTAFGPPLTGHDRAAYPLLRMRPVKVHANASGSVRRPAAVTRISSKNQTTLPVAVLHRAGLRAGEEVLVAPAKKGGGAVGRVDEALAALTLRIESITPAIARSAAMLRARHRSLRLPDALVLATADVLGAEKVLTADRAWPKISRRVR